MIMAKKYGYGRVSSLGQSTNGYSLDEQEDKLREAGCDVIKTEVFTGTTMDRPVFNEILALMEPGDTLVVCKLDRFARTASEGSTLAKKLMSEGKKLHILNMGLIEDSSVGKLILNVLLSFAEFERDMIVERTAEGRALARATNPDYKEGRKELEIPESFSSYMNGVDEGEITVTAACKEMGISRSTWYKWAKLEG